MDLRTVCNRKRRGARMISETAYGRTQSFPQTDFNLLSLIFILLATILITTCSRRY